MASRAIIDERGRLQIPRAEREKALIPPNSEVVVIPRSPGHLELVLVGEARLERFQKRVKGRLKGWREDEHKADAQLLKELRGVQNEMVQWSVRPRILGGRSPGR